MTYDQILSVKQDTRVLLADGLQGHFKGALRRSGLAAVYVFAERAVRYLPIASLIDMRLTEGELRERAAVEAIA